MWAWYKVKTLPYIQGFVKKRFLDFHSRLGHYSLEQFLEMDLLWHHGCYGNHNDLSEQYSKSKRKLGRKVIKAKGKITDRHRFLLDLVHFSLIDPIDEFEYDDNCLQIEASNEILSDSENHDIPLEKDEVALERQDTSIEKVSKSDLQNEATNTDVRYIHSREENADILPSAHLATAHMEHISLPYDSVSPSVSLVQNNVKPLSHEEPEGKPAQFSHR